MCVIIYQLLQHQLLVLVGMYYIVFIDNMNATSMHLLHQPRTLDIW